MLSAKEDFKVFLNEINFSEQQLKDWMKYMDKYYYIEEKSNIYYKKKSNIHGFGLFSCINIYKDFIIGNGYINNKRTPLARYTNHSNKPNIVFKKVNEDIIAVAIKDIEKDEELLVNYRHELLKQTV
jgi:hypothetical protein